MATKKTENKDEKQPEQSLKHDQPIVQPTQSLNTTPEKNQGKETGEQPDTGVDPVEIPVASQSPVSAEHTKPQPVMQTVEEAPSQSVAPDLSQPLDINNPEMVDTIDMGYTKTSSNKMLYLLIVVLTLILLSLVGLFFYRQYLNTTAEPAVTPTPEVTEKEENPSPTPSPVNDEDEELQSIEIEAIDSDITNLESELKEL